MINIILVSILIVILGLAIRPLIKFKKEKGSCYSCYACPASKRNSCSSLTKEEIKKFLNDTKLL